MGEVKAQTEDRQGMSEMIETTTEVKAQIEDQQGMPEMVETTMEVEAQVEDQQGAPEMVETTMQSSHFDFWSESVNNEVQGETGDKDGTAETTPLLPEGSDVQATAGTETAGAITETTANTSSRQASQLWGSVASAVSLTADFAANKAAEAAAAAQAHATSAGEYLSAKTNDAAAGISERASVIATATTDSLAVAKDVIVTKPTEAVIATRDSAIAKTTEAAIATRDSAANKAAEAAAAAQAHVASAGEYLSAKRNDAAAGISERASVVATATTDGLAVAKDVIVTKPAEAVIATRDSAIAKTTEAVSVTRDSATAVGDYVSAKAAEAVNLPFVAGSYIAAATTDQIETTKAAKLMLDEGCQDGEDRLIAKRAQADGVGLHNTAVFGLADAAKSLREAESKLRKVVTNATEAGAAPEFSRLAESYAERAAKLEAFLSTLEGDLEAPLISNKESIAIGILNTKLGYRSLWEPCLRPTVANQQDQEYVVTTIEADPAPASPPPSAATNEQDQANPASEAPPCLAAASEQDQADPVPETSLRIAVMNEQGQADPAPGAPPPSGATDEQDQADPPLASAAEADVLKC
jgi:hypothetical protein